MDSFYFIFVTVFCILGWAIYEFRRDDKSK